MYYIPVHLYPINFKIPVTSMYLQSGNSVDPDQLIWIYSVILWIFSHNVSCQVRTLLTLFAVGKIINEKGA